MKPVGYRVLKERGSKRQFLARRGEIRPDESVVVISTAHGLKFTGAKQRYHAHQLEGITPRLANQPISIPASVDAVLRAVEEGIRHRH